ncbi:WYL domain-containing protein [Hominifimenecus sp. rT4P-3]|uniref:WYL domain-containing protein n=1 Tax=Hominifimenecus sp. rT4P-3 TaxID=3242979 RepID=UPI003DA1E031
MMIFSELYSAYYNTVAAVLAEAVKHPLEDNELRHIVEKHAFGESILNIPPSFKEERWQLLKTDGTTPIQNTPSMPLTILQKRWLKAIAQDPRIRLFSDPSFDFPDIEPLFLPEDILIFDQYSDGDDYEDERYKANFRLILDAIKNRFPLSIEMINRKGSVVSRTIFPEYLEYSEKDDKFRLIGAGSDFGSTVNLGRIISCKPCSKPDEIGYGEQNEARPRSVVFELVDQRKALERVLLHFAHFEKRAEKMDEDKYRITVFYDKEDETEVVIRVLSFGPMIKVTAPPHFVGLIKQRLMEQKSCGQ